MLNQDADLAEFIIAQNKRELKMYPRSPIIVSPKVAKEIDLSGIHRMSDAEIAAALREWECAA